MHKSANFLVVVLVAAFTGFIAGGMAGDTHKDLAPTPNPRGSYVDLTTPEVQSFDSQNFAIVGIEQTEHLAGIKIEGRVINMTSVTFSPAQFEIEVGGEAGIFSVSQISPGDSTGFDVYIPDLQPENAKYGSIRYVSGGIKYYST